MQEEKTKKSLKEKFTKESIKNYMKRNKYRILIIVLAVLIIGSVPIVIRNYKPNGTTVDGDTVYVSESARENVRIPSTLHSKIITTVCYTNAKASEIRVPKGIKELYINGCENLTELDLTEYKYLENYHIMDCPNLTSVKLPEHLTFIPDNAFYGDTGLSSITIPENVTSIHCYAFAGCSSLKEINIPRGVNSIENAAFVLCTSLTSVSLPEGLTEISDNEFNGCTSLETLYIPDSVTSIGYYAFADCPLKNFTFNDQFETIYDSSFTAYTSYENGKYIGTEENPYLWCLGAEDGITELTLHKDCKHIAAWAFKENESIKSVVLPEGLIDIGSAAFNESAIEEIKLPSSVTKIGNGAFKKCTNLKTAELSENLKSINDSLFEECTSLEEVTFPSSVTEIGIYAFYGCKALKEVTLPYNLLSLGDYAFAGCELITSAYIPVYVNYIGYGVYSGCNLNSIEVDSANGTYSSFNGANAIIKKRCVEDNQVILVEGCRNTVIPETVTVIGAMAFYKTDIKEITIPDSVTKIESGAFEDCRFLEKITLSKNLESIGEYSFLSCIALNEISIPMITEIPYSAFAWCTSLVSIDMPSVTKIDNYAFSNTAFTSVTIPDTLKSIDSSFFTENDFLKDIYYEGTKKEWKNLIKSSEVNFSDDFHATVHCSNGDIKIN